MDKEWQHHSELFTVRLWQEEQGNDQVTWRGKVQHVTSGEARTPFLGRAEVLLRSFSSSSFYVLSLGFVQALCRESLELV